MNEDSRLDTDPQQILIEIPEQPLKPLRVIAPTNPVWTENKAQFIMRYLRYFVYITKHGTYIDGFAGPQAERETDSWAAKLVLDSDPERIQHLHLCHANPAQAARMQRVVHVRGARDSPDKRI